MNDIDRFSVIAGRLGQGVILEAVERLPGGVSAEVYALRLRDPRAGQRRVVLRQPGVDTHPGRQADRTAAHHALLSALHRAGLPVPEPLLLDTTTEVLPAPYLVMAFVAGTSEIDAERVPASLDVMADVLLRIHALSGHELPELPPRLDPLPEALDYLPAAAPSGLHRYLRDCNESAYRGQPGLLHGDFWPGNLLWQDDRLAAIIDWEDAALGDSLSRIWPAAAWSSPGNSVPEQPRGSPATMPPGARWTSGACGSGTCTWRQRLGNSWATGTWTRPSKPTCATAPSGSSVKPARRCSASRRLEPPRARAAGGVRTAPGSNPVHPQ